VYARTCVCFIRILFKRNKRTTRCNHNQCLYCEPGRANFNPQEGHKIRKDSPEGRACVYIYRGLGGGAGGGLNSVEHRYLQKNDIFIAIY
jgi:hypothetical protein